MKEHYSRQNLAGRNFSGKDLRHAVFRWCNLENANFDRANLEGADLIGANLSHATFREANLTSANLVGARLYDGIFDRADLTEADLRHTDIKRASFIGVKEPNVIRVAEDVTRIGRVVLHTDTWTVYIYKDKFRIGCKKFSAEELKHLTLEDLDKIHPLAVKWYLKWSIVIQMAQASLNTP